MPLRRAIVLAVGVVLGLTLIPRASATEPTVEDRIVQLINTDRTDQLVIHSGLLAAARDHSQEMARHGGLDHDGADERVNNAPPDPPEFNGAPDDGFGVAAWCENVTYTVGTSESEAPQRLYDQWHRSGAHQRCMMDTSRNVGAVGVYYDGQSWWATFIAEVDNTPPGAPAPKPRPEPADKPKPTQRPVASQAPADDHASSVKAPEPTPVGLVADPTAEPAQAEPQRDVVVGASDDAAASSEPVATEPAPEQPSVRSRSSAPAIAPGAAVPISAPARGIGWQELLAVIAVLTLATFLLRGALQRPRHPLRWDDVPLEEREPVGAGR